jgi:HD-GYP domain-containing protein (c-di-GMP phosphodiesterase class II)
METMQEAGKAGTTTGTRLRIFLCFTNPDITDLLTFSLCNFFDCDVKSFANAKDLVGALQGGSKPNLLVVDCAREDLPVLLEAARAVKIKVAVHHPKKVAPKAEGVEVVGVFSEPELLPGISAAMKAQGATAKNPALAENNPSYPYFRVGIPLLTRSNPLVADIYIKLSELKYIKLFHKGTPFGKEEVDKYHGSRKIEFLYVKLTEAEALTAKFNEALEKLLKEVPLPNSVSTPVSLATIETVHSLVNQVGFTPEVQRLVKNNVDLVLKEMYASPSLGSILKNLDLDKEKYIAAHSHMLAEVACALSIAMKWDSDTSFKKITMAALLHDMGLSNQKLARIKDQKELSEKKAEFTPSDLDEYRTHPRRASTLVAGLKEVPADVDKIIVQHHELPMGTGFPDALGAVHIHPLASLIMVAHDLVDWVIDHPAPEPDVEAFIEAHAEKYKVGNFRKILKALYSLQA